jgi:FixJ family two-component response regulator
MAKRGRPTAEIVLSDEERATLERWARRPKSAQALALRCRIVLAAAEGGLNQDIAAQLGVHPTTVGKWRARFAAIVSMACTTSPDRASPARSPTPTSSG